MGLDKAVDSLDIPRCSVKLGAEKSFVSCLNSENGVSTGNPPLKRSNDMVPLETEPLARDNKTTLH